MASQLLDAVPGSAVPWVFRCAASLSGNRSCLATCSYDYGFWHCSLAPPPALCNQMELEVSLPYYSACTRGAQCCGDRFQVRSITVWILLVLYDWNRSPPKNEAKADMYVWNAGALSRRKGDGYGSYLNAQVGALRKGHLVEIPMITVE